MQNSLPSKTSIFRDNTMLSAYKECPRKFQIRHKLFWRSSGTAMPLVFGSSWHAAMDAVWTFGKEYDARTLWQMANLAFEEKWKEEGLNADLSIEQIDQMSPRVPGVASAMLDSYIEQRWKMIREAELLACEAPFAVPLPNTEDVWYVGRLDKVVSYNGQRLVLEHKSTTEYKKDGGFKSAYIESWDCDSQTKGYEFGAGVYFNVDQVWVDAALVHKTVHDKFRFIPVAHQKPLLLEWIQDATDWVQRIEADTKRGYFPKNENSCVGKYGTCPFLNICRTVSNPAALSEPPAGYEVEEWKPFETLGLDKLIQGATNESATGNSSNLQPAA